MRRITRSIGPLGRGPGRPVDSDTIPIPARTRLDPWPAGPPTPGDDLDVIYRQMRAEQPTGPLQRVEVSWDDLT